MVAVRLSQQEQPHHCHDTGEIDDGRHICGLLVRAWYQALCQNAAENVAARQSPVGTGAVQPGPHLPLPPAKEMLHPGSRFQLAGDPLETYLLWLTEAHTHASEAGRLRIRPVPRRMPRSVWAVSAAVTPGGRAYQAGTRGPVNTGCSRLVTSGRVPLQPAA
jgi:hypothetical protein